MSLTNERSADPVIRAFIAIDLPAEVIRNLGNSLRYLRQVDIDGMRVARPNAIHLTLKFIGSSPESLVGDIAGVIDQVTQTHTALELMAGNIGAFPNHQRPRILWVGIRDESDRLTAIKKDLDSGLAKLGVPIDKRSYHPHLTIARLRQRRLSPEHIQTLKEIGPNIPISEMTFPVKSIALVQSILGPTGSEYIPRSRSVFAKII